MSHGTDVSCRVERMSQSHGTDVSFTWNGCPTIESANLHRTVSQNMKRSQNQRSRAEAEQKQRSKQRVGDVSLLGVRSLARDRRAEKGAPFVLGVPGARRHRRDRYTQA